MGVLKFDISQSLFLFISLVFHARSMPREFFEMKPEPVLVLIVLQPLSEVKGTSHSPKWLLVVCVQLKGPFGLDQCFCILTKFVVGGCISLSIG